MPPGRPLRAAVIGARRRRQGTGPYVARFLAAAGAEVVAIAGTSPATLAAAKDELAAAGLHPARYEDPEALFREARPDLVAITSPPETHAAWLEHALACGVHVLCEKPLVWGVPAPGQRAAALAGAFLRCGLHLKVAAQWPETLPAYRALHPEALVRAPSRFTMHMAPPRPGPAMIPDALPHPLSLLASVLPDPGAHLVDPEVQVLDAGGTRVHVRFGYAAAGHVVATTVVLRHRAGGPRPAGYAFDGRAVERLVDPVPYRLAFADGERSVGLPDPLAALVQAFVVRVSSAHPPQVDPAATPATTHVEALAAAWPLASGPAR